MAFIILIRDIVDDSDKITRSLHKELDFIRNHLEIEKSRSKQALTFEIDIGQDISTDTGIPKNIMLTFVENAIKHGIRPMKGTGKIIITAKGINDAVLIAIEDNGIGRKQASDIQIPGTGKGLKVVDQILDLYKNLKGIAIHYSIIDLQPQGTRIDIMIPVWPPKGK